MIIVLYCTVLYCTVLYCTKAILGDPLKCSSSCILTVGRTVTNTLSALYFIDDEIPVRTKNNFCFGYTLKKVLSTSLKLLSSIMVVKPSIVGVTTNRQNYVEETNLILILISIPIPILSSILISLSSLYFKGL